jgi:hypothetical protein
MKNGTKLTRYSCDENVNVTIEKIKSRLKFEEQLLKDAVNLLDEHMKSKESYDDHKWDKIHFHLHRIFYLQREIMKCNFIKEGLAPKEALPPKGRPRRMWCRDPFMDMVLEESHEKIKDYSPEELDALMESEMQAEIHREGLHS